MKGMILAAGLGTRLGALTKDRPKALMPIDTQRTILDVVVERLRSAGVTELIINLHYRGELIRKHVQEKGAYGIKVQFSEEPEILGTGGGIRNVESFFKGANYFLVHNCDVYSEISLPAMLEAHQRTGAVATLGVLSLKQDSYLLFDRGFQLTGWEMADGKKRDLARDVPDSQRLCYTGIQILSTEIFEYMRDEPRTFSIVSTFVKAARAGKLVQGFPLENTYWIDVGTVDKLEELRARIA